MKKNIKELDVDFIGEQEKITQEEEIALQEYFILRNKSKNKTLIKYSKQSKIKVKV